jgi:hypothetical protein
MSLLDDCEHVKRENKKQNFIQLFFVQLATPAGALHLIEKSFSIRKNFAVETDDHMVHLKKIDNIC